MKNNAQICVPVAIITLGCKLNQLESEAIADAFTQAGFPLVQGVPIHGPGIVIINTCTVTSKADQKCRRLIRKALRDNPDSCVIVTGCYAQLDGDEIASLEAEMTEGNPDAQRLFVVSTTGAAGTTKSVLLDLPQYLLTHLFPTISAEEDAPFVHSAPSSAPLRLCVESFFDTIKNSDRGGPFAFKPTEFAFHSRGYLKIQDGCNNCCTYCRTRLARGPGISLPPHDALAQLRSFEERGCAELMITGVNVTQYHHSGYDLAKLLEYLLKSSETIALRLASLEPERIDERLASVLAHPRIRPHFHLSVQSGSNAVLRRMGRAYNAHTVEQTAALLRSVKENPFLACDIIAGFPAESETEFAETLSLCKKINFAWIHAFPYSKRPGTKAFSMGAPVCEREVTRRVEALTQLALHGRRDYAASWLGRELSAIVEKGECTEGQCRAVAENYLKLIVDCSGERPKAGELVRCVPESLLCDGAEAEGPDARAKEMGERGKQVGRSAKNFMN